MAPTRIIGATLRDLSYVASNLRPDDKAEINSQFEGWTPQWLAMSSLRGRAWIVTIGNNPEAAFGATPTLNTGLWVAWSWGTKRMWRCVPLITEFVRDVLIPDLYADGCQRCEARAMARHSSAHRWLKRMGAKEQGLLECYGRNGEDFKLFEWTRKQYVLRRPHAPGQGSQTPAVATGTVIGQPNRDRG